MGMLYGQFEGIENLTVAPQYAFIDLMLAPQYTFMDFMLAPQYAFIDPH